MKLPFSLLLNPVIKPYFGESRMFCLHPTFSMSILYTYFCGSLGFLMNLNHIRRHLGELPVGCTESTSSLSQDLMLIHDLKIIATSMGVVQYACLLFGCYTENPALFLPHLAAQIIVFVVKILNVGLLLFQFNLKNGAKIGSKLFGIFLMAFNWLQEFCVFRQLLCICDL